MTTSSWIDRPLDYLIDPVPRDRFFAEFHERTHLHCSRDERGRYERLLSIARIDEILADTELPPESLQMARSDPPISRENFTFSNGVIDRGAVIRHYQQGATVIFPQLHLADATLFDFCQALELEFSAGVQTNIYLTPPNSQGFRTHYDDHDVFVLQVAGEKRWQLYDKPVDNPYRGEGFQPGEYEAGAPVDDFVLRAGECVYVPRGLMHDASTVGDAPSLHITVGIIVKTWADLMLEAVAEVALRNPAYRRSLPPGFANASFNRSAAKALFGELAARFSHEADFDESLELFIESFIRSRGQTVRGGLLDAQASIGTADRFRRRAWVLGRLRDDAEEVILVSAGGNLQFPVECLVGLKAVMSGREFDLADFGELAERRMAEDAIRKLLAFGVIERL